MISRNISLLVRFHRSSYCAGDDVDVAAGVAQRMLKAHSRLQLHRVVDCFRDAFWVAGRFADAGAAHQACC